MSCARDSYGTKTDFSVAEQVEAAEALVERVVGKQVAASFAINIVPEQKDGKDWFSYYADNDKIVLEGNDGVSVASALNHYLSDYCGWQRTWCGSSENLPSTLPLPEEKVLKTSPYKYRYYLNYCTFNSVSYTHLTLPTNSLV